MRILVVGSADHLQSEEEIKQFRKACEEIGMAIARAGHDIVVGPDKDNAAEEHVVRGVAKEEGHHKVYLYLTSDGSDKEITSIAIRSDNIELIRQRTKGPWESGRVDKIMASDAVMAIGGDEGTEQIGFTATKLQKPVLAIGCFGGSAEKLWKEYEQHYFYLARRNKKIHNLAKTWDAGFAELVVDSIERLVEEGLFRREHGGDEMITILFLSADPTDATRLRLGEEAREIYEKLQLAKLRDRFKLEQRWSVRPADISQALLDVQPQIVHFSGHGATTGALCFENLVGETHPVEPDALAALFEQFADQVNCVILNACYLKVQANAISEHINYVIGMDQAIGDRAAIAFAIGFYQAFGAGRTVEGAYELGCVQIRLQNIPEHLTPVLLKKGEVQP